MLLEKGLKFYAVYFGDDRVGVSFSVISDLMWKRLRFSTLYFRIVCFLRRGTLLVGL